ncbi:DUF2461 domain-containing protein [Undibacterium sp. RTI2.1]|uniref:DUF2461 domain-containing protein n=1 Tax=unclassified Undibacterium TaxID=2630295 RepID=UPI002AB3336D|nr:MULTISPECIES: DUF2461 domain-containing protein [unclassified Undibacterium]MDY7540198.1 DUF2461 domain-containing protein [Undibacterium sp. 5I1]MEB0030372.1 DUF2461 domain-containing protein [Undibacterium sp. RTI2.1]MEB0115347.1 DUF2461 domain-containing protein [Undibacterium sp. RTI2.2]MEB0232533.1 DUF2461 domain-containing protein [Undibacterium sp. 10I3]MEB0257125.1 DUF2461 domain-containing protein [Undibacterium sp. 5I1]
MHIRDLKRFLFELSENNNRAWFVMNKPRYDILRAEFLELVTDLIAKISKFDPAIIGCEPKKALFRINRDMRFSADKSPYKTTFSASILPSGRKKPSEGGGPAYYFQIDATGRLFFAVGEYMPPSDRLRAIRNQILADPEGFSKVLKNKGLKQIFGSLQEEGKLTRPPKGFDPESPHIEQIKLKNFMVWTEFTLDETTPEQMGEIVTEGFKAAYPLVGWLRTAASSVGPD